MGRPTPYIGAPSDVNFIFFGTVPLISGLYRFGISHVKAQISGHHGFALGRDSAFAFSRSWSSLLPYVIKSLRKWRATWLSSGFLPCAKHFFNTLAHFFCLIYTRAGSYIKLWDCA